VALPFKVSHKEQYSFFVYRGQKDLAQMPFSLRCDQCIVKSVLQDQQCTFWSKKFAQSQESVVDKKRPGRHQNTAARSFVIDNTFLIISKLFTPSVYCWFRKTLVTMHRTQFRVNNGICAGFCPWKKNNRILLITGYFEWQCCHIYRIYSHISRKILDKFSLESWGVDL